MIGGEGRALELARTCFALPDLLNVRRRMIGTGPIGGKSIGMLLAQAILRKADPSWKDFLEPHDSFFIGADVFYTYLVQNGLWWIKHADPEDPVLSEFLLPPLLEGVAKAEDPGNDDLEYMVEGVTYDPPPGGPPFEPTAALDYQYALVGQKTPPEEGDDEPVEPGGTHDPE